MGFWNNLANYIMLPPVAGVEGKSINVVSKTVTQRSADEMEALLMGGSPLAPLSEKVSAVYACARVIAEGLALPPCYVKQQIGNQRKLATDHPLFPLLNLNPNDRQTSYEFREMLAWHLALDGNAYVWINRNKQGQIVELLPADPGKVTIQYDESKLWNKPVYYLYGIPVPSDQIWHLRGPTWLSWKGIPTIQEARNAIGLASATELFGAKLFENGARPSVIITPQPGVTLTQEQSDNLKAQMQAYSSAANAHKTMVANGAVNVETISSTADEAQFIETRKFQIEEICRFFRVSPLKVFQQVGSHSYASVEQAHIAHEQDTDAHWHQRFAQSASLNLLTARERATGFSVEIDNNSIKQGATAGEKMAFFTAGASNGFFTQNEARSGLGYDPVDDPEADKLKKAANIAGNDAPLGPDAPTKDETPKNTG